MRPQSRDTPLEVERIQIEGFRAMTPLQKLERVLDLNRAVEALASARLRKQYGPELSEHELELRLAALRLDRQTMVAAFGWDPLTRGL
jgi:hypothetical protein